MNPAEARALAADILAGIAPEAELATVGEDQDLRAALDLDSMDFLNFTIALHERLGVEIPEGDLPKLFTLDGGVAYLRGKLAEAG